MFCLFVFMPFRKNCVLIHFDADLASEAHARPNYRPPPMTETLAKKLIWGALSGRGAVPIGILDGCRDSAMLMSPFKQGKGKLTG